MLETEAVGSRGGPDGRNLTPREGLRGCAGSGDTLGGGEEVRGSEAAILYAGAEVAAEKFVGSFVVGANPGAKEALVLFDELESLLSSCSELFGSGGVVDVRGIPGGSARGRSLRALRGVRDRAVCGN